MSLVRWRIPVFALGLIRRRHGVEFEYECNAESLGMPYFVCGRFYVGLETAVSRDLSVSAEYATSLSLVLEITRKYTLCDLSS